MAGVLVLGWLLLTGEFTAGMGIIGIIVFWVSWERHYIGGADAMALITCLILWPGIEFVVAYLVAGLIWSLGGPDQGRRLAEGARIAGPGDHRRGGDFVPGLSGLPDRHNLTGTNVPDRLWK